MAPDQNPFAPPESEPELADAFKPAVTAKKSHSLGWIATRWLVVCAVSAVPSFYLGTEVSKGQFAAMTLGILIFAAIYIFLDCKTSGLPFRQNRLCVITLRMVYVTRMVITVIFPIAMFVDLICGLTSVACTETIFGSRAIQTFPGALFTTLLQGVMLNLVLAIYGLFVIGLVMLFAPLFRNGSVPSHGPRD